MVVAGCAYGERQSGKKYRLWMSSETRERFTPVHPASDESQCAWCKNGEQHPQGYCPKKGQDKQRVSLEGFTTAAARNRVPPGLAEAVAKAQQQAREALKEA